VGGTLGYTSEGVLVLYFIRYTVLLVDIDISIDLR